MSEATTIRLEDLLGRRVVALNGRRVGRLEEARVRRRGDEYEVTDWLLGSGALLERLGIRRLFGRPPRTLVAHWDQLDVRDPRRPRLTCSARELRVETPRSPAPDGRSR